MRNSTTVKCCRQKLQLDFQHHMTSEHLFQHQPASSFGRVTKFTVGGYNNCQWGNEPSANGGTCAAHRFSEIIRLPKLVTNRVSKTWVLEVRRGEMEFLRQLLNFFLRNV